MSYSTSRPHEGSPQSPTPVNDPRPGQIESRLLPQLDTAPRVPIHTPDTVMPENPPIQKSPVAMLTPPRRSAREIRAPERFSLYLSLDPKQGLINREWGDVTYENFGNCSPCDSTEDFQRVALKAMLEWINRMFLLVIPGVILQGSNHKVSIIWYLTMRLTGTSLVKISEDGWNRYLDYFWLPGKRVIFGGFFFSWLLWCR